MFIYELEYSSCGRLWVEVGGIVLHWDSNGLVVDNLVWILLNGTLHLGCWRADSSSTCSSLNLGTNKHHKKVRRNKVLVNHDVQKMTRSSMKVLCGWAKNRLHSWRRDEPIAQRDKMRYGWSQRVKHSSLCS